MASTNESRHTVDWPIANLTDGQVESKAFAMQVFDREVTCIATFYKSFYQRNNGYGMVMFYQQGFFYQLTWPDCENKPIRYSCNVQVLNNGAVAWSDKKEDYVCSSVNFPKNTATLNVSVGTVAIKFAFNFRLEDHRVKRSFLTLLKEKVLTDVVVVCGKSRFDCHKIVLARHSEVFERMLTSEFREASEGKIIITVRPYFIYIVC
jgi:hypothetical protein